MEEKEWNHENHEIKIHPMSRVDFYLGSGDFEVSEGGST